MKHHFLLFLLFISCGKKNLMEGSQGPAPTIHYTLDADGDGQSNAHEDMHSTDPYSWSYPKRDKSLSLITLQSENGEAYSLSLPIRGIHQNEAHRKFLLQMVHEKENIGYLPFNFPEIFPILNRNSAAFTFERRLNNDQRYSAEVNLSDSQLILLNENLQLIYSKNNVSFFPSDLSVKNQWLAAIPKQSLLPKNLITSSALIIISTAQSTSYHYASKEKRLKQLSLFLFVRICAVFAREACDGRRRLRQSRK